LTWANRMEWLLYALLLAGALLRVPNKTAGENPAGHGRTLCSPSSGGTTVGGASSGQDVRAEGEHKVRPYRTGCRQRFCSRFLAIVIQDLGQELGYCGCQVLLAALEEVACLLQNDYG
jgi:hypothetical protein